MSYATITTRILGSSAPSHDLFDAPYGLALDNKRTRRDRRCHNPLFADWRWSYRGRRKDLRRASDSYETHTILDWYRPSLLFFIVTTYVLSGIDAILTLTLLEMRVATEANPVMHMLLAENVQLFAGVKALITGMGLVCLTAYSNRYLFTRLRVDRLIYALFVVYSVLVVSEIRLLMLAESLGWPT